MKPAFRIFQIGFNRCGTTTLARFFRRNVIPSIHWHRGKLAVTMYNNLAAGRPLISGYGHKHFFADMETLTESEYLPAYKLYPQLAKENPGALFLLNTRDCDAWLRSRILRKSYLKRYRMAKKLASNEAVVNEWRRDWIEHHSAVRKFFDMHPDYRFLEFNIDLHKPEQLVGALPELKLDPIHYGHLNTTPEALLAKFTNDEVKGLNDSPPPHTIAGGQLNVQSGGNAPL